MVSFRDIIRLKIDVAFHDHCDVAAKKIIHHVGKKVVIGVPLGLGKPIGLLNALYRIACEDKSIVLTIVTGLTLARPTLHNELEKRFVGPVLDRILKDYEDPLYEQARVLQQVPNNIKILEFFLTPGKFLNNRYVQQNYICSKYTSAARDSLYYSINVLAQLVTRSNSNSRLYSLSCNADLFHEVAFELNKLRDAGQKISIVGEVNLNLPFMHGDAVVDEDVFTDIIDTRHYKTLFAMPREALSMQDHLIGVYTSCLIKDGCCLQIGIGKLGDAVANASILRHKANNSYRDLLQKLLVAEKFGNSVTAIDLLTPFEKGLYASTEMLSDEYLALYKEGILKKRVYDHIGLQKLLNLGKINEIVNPRLIDVLLEYQIINFQLTGKDVDFLQHFGIFKVDFHYNDGYLVFASGEKIKADLTVHELKQRIVEQCLGQRLQMGKISHAAFFIGSVDFYRELNNLSSAELEQISMTSVLRTNALSWSPDLLKLQRKDARFINTAMMITLGGEIVSDGLKNLNEVSGVGGQFDFVNMAQELEDARSIIVCRSTRKIKNGVQSNILWNYPNTTIPRYLRDIVITEYGIADCRGKTDADIIKTILNVTDSRFQEKLLAKAKRYGKLPLEYEIPACFKQNYPAYIEDLIHDWKVKGYFKAYPFGSDLTNEEIILQRALLGLKNSSKLKLFMLAMKALFYFPSRKKFEKYLDRMQLIPTKTIKDWFYARLLMLSLRSSV